MRRGIEFHEVYPEQLASDGKRREARVLSDADLIARGARYEGNLLEMPHHVIKGIHLEMEQAMERGTDRFRLEESAKQKARHVYMLLGKFTGEHVDILWKDPEVQRQKDTEAAASLKQALEELKLQFYDLSNRKAVLTLMQLFYDISGGEKIRGLVDHALSLVAQETHGMNHAQKQEYFENKAREILIAALYGYK